MCFSPKPNQTLWTVSFTFGPFFNIKTSCVNWGKPSFQCLVVNRCLVLIFTQLIYGLVCLSQRGRCNKGIWSSSRSCQYPLLAPDPKRPSSTRDTGTLLQCVTPPHCHSVSDCTAPLSHSSCNKEDAATLCYFSLLQPNISLWTRNQMGAQSVSDVEHQIMMPMQKWWWSELILFVFEPLWNWRKRHSTVSTGFFVRKSQFLPNIFH